MYKILTLALLFIAILSCKKEDDAEPIAIVLPPPLLAATSFSADIDGTNFSGNTFSAVIQSGEMQIEATDGTKIIRFTITEEGEGTFLLGSNGVATGEYLPTGDETDIYTLEGVLTISSINSSAQKVSANFEGSANGSSGNLTVTAATFVNIPYTGIFTGAGVGVLQEGDVDLDGAAFSPTLITGNEGFGKIALNLARNNGAEAIGVSLDKNSSAGEYDFTNPNALFGTYSASGNPDGQYVSSVGNFVLTSHNTSEKNIKGTFEFTAIPTPGNSNTNTHQIENATFSINY
ncbi:MAG: DUF6252 family protein [Lishizhenia sp.]